MKRIFKITLLSLFLVLITACGKTKSYTITFDSNGGTKIDAIVITEQERIELPSEPVKEGYIFNGWLINGEIFNESTQINNDITLKADWISIDKKTYKVIFIYNNNTKDLEINVEEYTKVSKPSNPTKEGYKFLGWYLDNEKFNFDKEINSDIILFAKWEKQEQNNNNTNNNNTSSNTNTENTNTENTTNNNTNDNTGNNTNNNTNQKQDIISATRTYSCEDNSYTLDGNRCKKVISINANLEYSCPSGYTKEGDTCSKKVQNKITADIIKTPSCRPGFTLNGSRCEMGHEMAAYWMYGCDSGQTVKGTDCYKTEYKVVSSQTINSSWSETTKTSYYNTMQNACSSYGGQIVTENNKWNCYAYSDVKVGAATKKYYCDSGYTLSGTNCYGTYIQEPDYQRTCPSGYTLSVNNCYKLEYDVETIAVTKNYICSSEYTLSGDKCQKEISVLANEVYTCPQNYTLKGATCYSD